MSGAHLISRNSLLLFFIGIGIGIIGVYYTTSQPLTIKIQDQESEINALTNTISNINTQISELRKNNSDLQYKIGILEEEKIIVQSQINTLQEENSNLISELSDMRNIYEKLLGTLEKYEKINQSYTNLLNTLNMTIIQNFTQSIDYNISAGTEKTWEFLIPNYGIIWEAKISFSGDYVSMSHAWRRGEERVFVGSSGISLVYKGSVDIIYYGIQDHLWGTITVDYCFVDYRKIYFAFSLIIP